MNQEFFEEAESIFEDVTALLYEKQANSLPLVAALSTIIGQTSVLIKDHVSYDELDLMVVNVINLTREETSHAKETLN